MTTTLNAQLTTFELHDRKKQPKIGGAMTIGTRGQELSANGTSGTVGTILSGKMESGDNKRGRLCEQVSLSKPCYY